MDLILDCPPLESLCPLLPYLNVVANTIRALTADSVQKNQIQAIRVRQWVWYCQVLWRGVF